MLSCKAISNPKSVFYPIYDKIIIPTIINILNITSLVALSYLNLNKFIIAVCIRVIFYFFNLWIFYFDLKQSKIIEQTKDKKKDRIILAFVAILFQPLLPIILLIVIQYYNKQQIISSQYIAIPNDNDDNIITPIINKNDENDLVELDTKYKLNDYIEWINNNILMYKLRIDHEIYWWMVLCQFEFVANLVFCSYYTSINMKYGFIYFDYTLFINDKYLLLRILPAIYFIFTMIFSIKVLFYWITETFKGLYHNERMLLVLPTEYILFVLTIILDIFGSFCIYSFYAKNTFTSYWNYHYFPMYSVHIGILFSLFHWICIDGPAIIWFERGAIIDYFKNHKLLFLWFSFLTLLLTALYAWLLYWALFGVFVSLFSFLIIILSNQYKMTIRYKEHESFRKMWLNLCNFLLNSTSKKDELYRIMSIKSILHSSGLVENDKIYKRFINYTTNDWLIPSTDDGEYDIKSFINKPLSNIQRLKDVICPFFNFITHPIGFCLLWFMFIVVGAVILISKITIIPYLLIKWILNIDSMIEYILCFIYCLLLLIIICFIVIIWKQRKLINHIVLNDEKWNAMKYDLNEINHFNSDIEERYESLITFKEIKKILNEYFIEEIGNIIWFYSCGPLTYREMNDFRYEFGEISLPITVDGTKQYGLFISNFTSKDDVFNDKEMIGAQIIAANNHNLEYKSFDKACDCVQKAGSPITIIFRPRY